MSTKVARIPERLQQEVQAAARVTGRSTGELLEAAWQSFKATPEFEIELKEAQKALLAGDIEQVTDLIIEHAARSKASAIRESRREAP